MLRESVEASSIKIITEEWMRMKTKCIETIWTDTTNYSCFKNKNKKQVKGFEKIKKNKSNNVTIASINKKKKRKRKEDKKKFRC